MKQAQGYKTIMEKWIELQQGYELEEGMRKLEIKDICDLYEIWCFIKVKNIVQDVMKELGKNAKPKVNERDVTNDFIPQLVYGGSISFINNDGIELASVCYNAEVHKGNYKSAISGTNTITTVQRPDIVLRLSKHEEGGMKYTYLFDAKYRIADTDEDSNCYGSGYDVPPVDAIDQMHRYRDAIYYTEEGRDREHLKRKLSQDMSSFLVAYHWKPLTWRLVTTTISSQIVSSELEHSPYAQTKNVMQRMVLS